MTEHGRLMPQHLKLKLRPIGNHLSGKLLRVLFLVADNAKVRLILGGCPIAAGPNPPLQRASVEVGYTTLGSA